MYKRVVSQVIMHVFILYIMHICTYMYVSVFVLVAPFRTALTVVQTGHTPLYIASSLGHVDVVRALLEAGANKEVLNIVSRALSPRRACRQPLACRRACMRACHGLYSCLSPALAWLHPQAAR